MKRKWEYITYTNTVLAGVPANHFLNKMDAEGWELVCRATENGMASYKSGDYGLNMWIFRRPWAGRRGKK